MARMSRHATMQPYLTDEPARQSGFRTDTRKRERRLRHRPDDGSLPVPPLGGRRGRRSRAPALGGRGGARRRRPGRIPSPHPRGASRLRSEGAQLDRVRIARVLHRRFRWPRCGVRGLWVLRRLAEDRMLIVLPTFETPCMPPHLPRFSPRQSASSARRPRPR